MNHYGTDHITYGPDRSEEHRLEKENITLCIRLAEYEMVSQHEFIVGLTRDEVEEMLDWIHGDPDIIQGMPLYQAVNDILKGEGDE